MRSFFINYLPIKCQSRARSVGIGSGRNGSDPAPTQFKPLLSTTVEGHVTLPEVEGMCSVSPGEAAVIQSVMSVWAAEAAVQLGLEPPHTAIADAVQSNINRRS